MKAAVEHHFTGTTGLTGITGGTGAGYDSSKTMIASLLRQATGANVEDKFISTDPSAMVNIGEVFSSNNYYMPHVVKWSNNIYWIFSTSTATGATRNISLAEFDSNTFTITYRGFITLQGTVVSGTKTPRSLRGFVYRHTSGTVSTSGSSTTITGSSTQFTTDRIAVGARIGFGTTDATAVTTWYEISAIASDTSLTINSPVNLSAGTSYVIEETRIAFAVSNSTLMNAGIHLIKGLHPGVFTNGGTNITEAVTTDNVRASYILKDPVGTLGTISATVTYSTTNILALNNHGFNVGDTIQFTTTSALPTGLSTNTTYFVISTNLGTNQFSVSTTFNGAATSITAAGTGTHTVHAATNSVASTIAEDTAGQSATNHDLYLVNAGAGNTAQIVKYNMRAALTVGSQTGGVASGASISAYVLKTNCLAVTGTVSTINSGRIFTVSHGPASGVKSLYFATNSRIYRCPVSSLTSGSTNFLPDVMVEVPPGGSVNYSTLSAFSQVEYISTLDRLLITNTGGRFGIYVTPYQTDAGQFEKIAGSNLNRLKISTTPGGASDGLFPATTPTIWSEDGWLFTIPNATTSGQNWLMVLPAGADAYYNSTSNQHIITPKMATPGATKLYSVYLDHQEYAGTYGLGFPVETYRVWYRTSGIDNNSGAWTELPVGADIQDAAAGEYIQFKIAFDILGEICVPTRIYSITCLYEDGSQDSHYQPSLTKSSATNRQFAWKQVSSWGGTIPSLQIRLYNASNGLLVHDDDTTGNYGTWEYSTNGTVWNAWSSSADTIGNYIRYTAISLPNNITVRALLTQV